MSAPMSPTSPASPSKSSAKLQPPRPSLEDPGAHELESSENEEDHFSDASEGQQQQQQQQQQASGHYGFSPEQHSPRQSISLKDQPPPPQQGPGSPVPITVVEKVDPFTPSYGEVPGTIAYDIRQADAEPDIVTAREDNTDEPRPRGESASEHPPVPITKVTKVDHSPEPAEVPGTHAYEKHKQDAEPDVVEEQDDAPAPEGAWIQSSTVNEASVWGDAGVWGTEPQGTGETRDEHDEPENNIAPGDDFDDFEEGQQDDDFEEFDDGFAAQEAADDESHLDRSVPATASQSFTTAPIVSPLNYDNLDDPEDVLQAVREITDKMFPDIPEAKPPPVPDPTAEGSLFVTERSLSLWSQLVTAPPLQPSNWVRSRTRRLFLVSLGVPVDLDEILPSSKQKKLVLPSPHATSEADRASGSAADGGSGPRDHPPSSTSLQQPATSGTPHKKSPPAPTLDLAAARLACSPTEAALNNLTDEELRDHVRQLEAMTQQAQDALDHWLRRRDDARGDKAAFEGVIENLVKHARRVRR